MLHPLQVTSKVAAFAVLAVHLATYAPVAPPPLYLVVILAFPLAFLLQVLMILFYHSHERERDPTAVGLWGRWNDLTRQERRLREEAIDCVPIHWRLAFILTVVNWPVTFIGFALSTGGREPAMHETMHFISSLLLVFLTAHMIYFNIVEPHLRNIVSARTKKAAAS